MNAQNAIFSFMIERDGKMYFSVFFSLVILTNIDIVIP